MLLAVNFHYVRPTFNDTPYRGFYGVTPTELKTQLLTLASIGEFVSGEQIKEAILDRRQLPERAIVITFDDGLREQFELALPVLMELNVPAIFFVNTNPIVNHSVETVHKIHLLRSRLSSSDLMTLIVNCAGNVGMTVNFEIDRSRAVAHYRYDEPAVADLKYLLNFMLDQAAQELVINSCFVQQFGNAESAISQRLYMDRDQVRELGKLGYVGSHGHKHAPVGLRISTEVQADIVESLQHLKGWCGDRPCSFSYPYGSRQACPLSSAPILRSLGIQFAFTMERAVNEHFVNPHHLARCACNDVPGGSHSLYKWDSFLNQCPISSWYRQH